MAGLNDADGHPVQRTSEGRPTTCTRLDANTSARSSMSHRRGENAFVSGEHSALSGSVDRIDAGSPGQVRFQARVRVGATGYDDLTVLKDGA